MRAAWRACQGSSGDGRQQVHGDRLRLGIERGEFREHGAAIFRVLAETEDSYAAQRQSSFACAAQRGRTIIVGPGSNDVAIMIAANVEIVVIGV
jgi:hypothetical protein